MDVLARRALKALVVLLQRVLRVVEELVDYRLHRGDIKHLVGRRQGPPALFALHTVRLHEAVPNGLHPPGGDGQWTHGQALSHLGKVVPVVPDTEGRPRASARRQVVGKGFSHFREKRQREGGP